MVNLISGTTSNQQFLDITITLEEWFACIDSIYRRMWQTEQMFLPNQYEFALSNSYFGKNSWV